MKEEFEEKLGLAHEVNNDEIDIHDMDENPVQEAADQMGHVAGFLSSEEKKSSNKAILIVIGLIVAILVVGLVINFASGNTIFGEPKHETYEPLP